MKTEFVSIVGLSRSGTSLISRILNKSYELGITHENHFLGHYIKKLGARYKFRKFGDLSDDSNVYKLIDYLFSGEFERNSKYRDVSYHWRWLVKYTEKELFTRKILKSERSERALFVASLEAYAEFFSKPIIGEKTPVHYRYIDTLLEWFPNGKIIHMLRDPRAIFVSELRRRKMRPISTPFRQLSAYDRTFKIYILLQTIFLWYDNVFHLVKNKKCYPNNYFVLKFEDLVCDPETHIRYVCDFLGISFNSIMTQQEVVSEGFKKGQKGFDKQASNRWKSRIDPWVNSNFLLIFRAHLKKFGYIDK